MFGLLPDGAAASGRGRFALELELGPVWQSRNDVQIPNDATGTRFSLADVTGTGPWPAGRLSFTWNFRDRHGLRLLAAPLRFTETGSLGAPTGFAGETFSPGVPTEAAYRFDSWRLTYRYRFRAGERWRWWIGFTAKIRDAEIRLEQGAIIGRKTDVGFVPLLHVRGDWRFADRWHLLVDLDALAGGPGRAEDLALKIGCDVSAAWHVAGGYRTIEGGADVDEVYNFAWLHAAVVSATLRF